MTAPAPTPENRACRRCETPLARRPGEKPYAFRQRRYCNWDCAHPAKPDEQDGPVKTVPPPKVRDWRHDAICCDEDPELFFPVGTSGPALMQLAEAKTVCRGCPVQDRCLQWALDTGQDDGVWGGQSEDERRRVSREPTRTALPQRSPLDDLHALPLYAQEALMGANAKTGLLPDGTQMDAKSGLVAAGYATDTLSRNKLISVVRLNRAGLRLQMQVRDLHDLAAVTS